MISKSARLFGDAGCVVGVWRSGQNSSGNTAFVAYLDTIWYLFEHLSGSINKEEWVLLVCISLPSLICRSDVEPSNCYADGEGVENQLSKGNETRFLIHSNDKDGRAVIERGNPFIVNSDSRNDFDVSVNF